MDTESMPMENYDNASEVTRDVVDQILARDAHGQRKYGVSLDRKDLTHSQWLQHMAEELMDGAHYALAAKREFSEQVLVIVVNAAFTITCQSTDRFQCTAFDDGVKALADAIKLELSK